MSLPDSQPAREIFAPRVGADRLAPFNPSTYFYVAIFGGVIAVAVVAAMNLPRLTVVKRLKESTHTAIAAMIVAAVLYLILAPTDWWDPTRNIRLGLRIVAAAGGSILYWLHRGPALGTMQRSGDFMSTWKAIGPICGAALVQGILVAGYGAASGAM